MDPPLKKKIIIIICPFLSVLVLVLLFALVKKIQCLPYAGFVLIYSVLLHNLFVLCWTIFSIKSFNFQFLSSTSGVCDAIQDWGSFHKLRRTFLLFFFVQYCTEHLVKIFQTLTRIGQDSQMGINAYPVQDRTWKCLSYYGTGMCLPSQGKLTPSQLD